MRQAVSRISALKAGSAGGLGQSEESAAESKSESGSGPPPLVAVRSLVPLQAPAEAEVQVETAGHRFFQTFDSALQAKVWAVYFRTGLAEKEESSSGILKESSKALCPITKFGEEHVLAASISNDIKDGGGNNGVCSLLVALDSCRLVATDLVPSGTYGALLPRSGERFDCAIELPYRVEEIHWNSDGSLAIVSFGSFNKQNSEEAALLVGVSRGDPSDQANTSSSKRLRLTVIRRLSRAYIQCIPGTLCFSQLDSRQIMFAKANFTQQQVRASPPSPAETEQGVELSVGVIKLSRSEVVHQVEASVKTSGIFDVQFGSWNQAEDSVALVVNSRELFLYHRKRRIWNTHELEIDVDVVRWHPSGLVLAVGNIKSQETVLLDCALQTLSSVHVQWPQGLVETISRGIFKSGKTSDWALSCHGGDRVLLAAIRDQYKKAEAKRIRAAAAALRKDQGGGNDATANSSKSDSESSGGIGGPLSSRDVNEVDPLALQASLDRMTLVSFVSNGAMVVSRFPALLSATWRAILRCHLDPPQSDVDDMQSRKLEAFRRASTFTLALESGSESYLRANRSLLVELGRSAAAGLLPLRSRDLLHHWMQQILVAIRDSVERSGSAQWDSHTAARWLALVEASERKFVSDRLRLGQVELACQFAFKLAERAPDRRHIWQLLDNIVVWAAAFGQSDTIAPLARSAAQRLRQFQIQQRQKQREESGDQEYDTVDDDNLSQSILSELSNELNLSHLQESDEKDEEESQAHEATTLLSVEEGDAQISSEDDDSEDEDEDEEDYSDDDEDDHSSVSSMSSQAPVLLRLPEWQEGGGGSIVPEDLGKTLEQLQQGTSKKAFKKVELLWREWRKAQNSDDIYSPSTGTGGELYSLNTSSPSSSSSLSSGTQGDTPTSHKSNRVRSKGENVLGPNGLLAQRDALTLATWLECRGKFSQALEVYQLHGLHRERQQLSSLQLVVDPNNLDLVPDVVYTTTHE